MDRYVHAGPALSPLLAASFTVETEPSGAGKGRPDVTRDEGGSSEGHLVMVEVKCDG
jgi:hypothetical protein